MSYCIDFRAASNIQMIQKQQVTPSVTKLLKLSVHTLWIHILFHDHVFFQHLYHKISSIFSYNSSIVPVFCIILSTGILANSLSELCFSLKFSIQ